MSTNSKPASAAERTSPLSPARKVSFRGSTAGGTLIIMILYVIAVSIYKPAFLTPSNWMNIVRSVATIGIMSSTLTFVMLTGNIDLSCGSILSLTGCVACSLIDTSPILAVLVPILVGGLVGLLNGLLVGKIKLNSFVATLGMQSVIQATAFFYTNSEYLSSTSQSWYRQIGQGWILGIPTPAILFLAVVLVCDFIQRRTVFGARLYAVGSNPISSMFSGIHSSWMVVKAYVIGGLGIGLSGVVLMSRTMSSQPKMGEGYEFEVLTAVVVGGLSMSGGKGNAWGTFLGVLFVGILSNGFTVMGFNHNVQNIVLGAVLIVAVFLSRLTEGRKGT